MSDETDTTPSPAPAPPAQPPAPGPTPAPASAPAAVVWPPAPPRTRRATALRAAAVLVAIAVLGSYCYTVVRHKQHDSDAARPAATWTAPTPAATKAFGAKSGGSHYGSLALLLLPVPDDYDLGPDVDAFGNDVVLTAGKASTLVKGETGGLTAKERRQLDAGFAALHVQGAGLRTYALAGHGLVVQMELVQMKNKRAARADTVFFTAYTKSLGGFRKGPGVPGHPQATCVLPKRDRGEQLDGMFCQATEGDLLVKMTATGIAPLPTAAAVDLLDKQLDRIKDPGESV